RKVRHDLSADGIADCAHDDRNRRGCLLDGHCRRSAPCDDHVHRQIRQLSSKAREAFVVAIRKPRLQTEVITFDIPVFSQPPNNPLDRRQGLRGKDANDMRTLLCARRERPRCRRTTEQCDEIAPPYSITSSAVVSSQRILRRSVLLLSQRSSLPFQYP